MKAYFVQLPDGVCESDGIPGTGLPNSVYLIVPNVGKVRLPMDTPRTGYIYRPLLLEEEILPNLGLSFDPKDPESGDRRGYVLYSHDASEIVGTGRGHSVTIFGIKYSPEMFAPREYSVQGYASLEKVVKAGNFSSARINVPPSWRGIRVRVIALDPMCD